MLRWGMKCMSVCSGMDRTPDACIAQVPSFTHYRIAATTIRPCCGALIDSCDAYDPTSFKPGYH
jgi:hypothetical protein